MRPTGATSALAASVCVLAAATPVAAIHAMREIVTLRIGAAHMPRHSAEGQSLGATGIVSSAQRGTIHFGRAVVSDSLLIDVGPLRFDYSVNVPGRTGFVYSRPIGKPTMFFADLKRPSDCEAVVPAISVRDVPGYTGTPDICTIRDAAARSYFDTNVAQPPSPSLVVGDRGSGCYTGLLLFRQGEVFGALDPVEIDNDGTLTFDWWYDAAGGGDFSRLCAPLDPEPIYLPYGQRPRPGGH